MHSVSYRRGHEATANLTWSRPPDGEAIALSLQSETCGGRQMARHLLGECLLRLERRIPPQPPDAA